MDYEKMNQTASRRYKSKLFSDILTKTILLMIFILISVPIFVNGNTIIQVNNSDFEPPPISYRLKRASSLSSTTLKPQSKASTQTTTKDPMTVLAEQLADISKQREADRRQDEENRKKDREKQEIEAKLREQEKRNQEAEVIRQREEAAAKQPQTKPIEVKNQTDDTNVKIKQDESGGEKLDDEKIQEKATQLLAQKYLRGQSQNDTIISDLISQCGVDNCFNKVIKQAVDKILPKIKISTLIKTERKLNSSVEESTYIYKLASDKISKKDFTTWTELAVRVKEIMNVKTSSNINIELKRIKTKLPIPITNLVFSTKVCIRNVKYNEFLYAVGSPELWYDNNRRQVYTRLEGGRNDTGETNEFYWILQSANSTNAGEFTILNRKHKEYLFVDSFKWDERNRFVFTWTDDKPVTRHVWQIALNSDGRYFEVKNTANNEYLFADYDRIFEGTMRSVFTYTDGSNSVEGLWDFVNCSKEK